MENRDTLKTIVLPFFPDPSLDASPQNLQTSHLSYTVSAAWMGYFVDDPIHKLLEKLLAIYRARNRFPLTPRSANVFHYPVKEAKSLKPKARRTERRAQPGRAWANPKDSLRKPAGLSTNSTRLAGFQGTAIFSNGYVQHGIAML